MTPSIKLAGWAPDLDPTTPGVITDCTMLEPSLRGMRSAPSTATAGVAALAAECRGSALVTKLNGTRRLLAGTQTRIYEANSTAWTDYSAASYTGSADSRWEFRQFGDVTIAVNGVDDPQSGTAATFTALTAMPVAKLVETVAGFVMVANISDASWPYSDGWWCSALLDETDWTPDVATQSARSRLVETPGEITALRALGGDAVVFKTRSMYIGRYVGPDPIWSWQRVPGDVGAFAQQGVVSDGTALYFWGGDDFYRFDGSRPQPIGQAVRRWFGENSNPLYLYRMTGQYDRRASIIRWYFAGSGSTTLNQCIVLNSQTGQWGRADRAVESVVDFVPSALTYDAAGALTVATYDSTQYLQSFDSPFWTAGAESPAVFDSAHVVQLLSGGGEASSMTTGVLGDDERVSLLKRARLRYADAPTTASVTEFYGNESGGTYSQGSTAAANDGKHDFRRASRWHYMRADWTGVVEVTGYAVDVTDTGVR